MRFQYYEYITPSGTTIYRPEIPLMLKNGHHFILVDANIDTGADYTILPIELATPLNIKLDTKRKAEFYGAGNNSFTVYQSSEKIDCIIRQKDFESIKITSKVYFAESQTTILLGQKGFLEKLKVTFNGPKKFAEILE